MIYFYQKYKERRMDDQGCLSFNCATLNAFYEKVYKMFWIVLTEILSNNIGDISYQKFNNKSKMIKTRQYYVPKNDILNKKTIKIIILNIQREKLCSFKLNMLKIGQSKID